MKLAALADETTVIPFLDAVRELSGWQLVCAWSSNEEVSAAIQRWHPGAERLHQWEMLLQREVDAVLVAGASDGIVAASRALAEKRTLLLLVTDTLLGPSRLFRFMSISQDAPGRLVPLFRSGMRGVMEAALEALTSAMHGNLWKVDFIRTVAATPEDRTLSPTQIDRLFFQDLDWISRVSSRHEQVTMHTAGPNAEHPVEAMIALSGTGVPEVRWRVVCDDLEHWELRLVGTCGQISVRCEANRHPVVEVDGRLRPLAIDDTLRADAEFQLRTVAQWRADGVPLLVHNGGLTSPARQDAATDKAGSQFRNWNDVVRFAEIGAAARRSLARRRTVDIHFEQATERSQFKSQMTALGCGALLWCLVGTILLLAVAGIMDPRDREYRTAAAAGFVLSQRSFVPLEKTLSPPGERDLKRIAASWSATSPVLIIESAAADNLQLDAPRTQAVVEFLSTEGVRDPAMRIVIRPLTGRWFEGALLIGWIAVFGPLALVLLLQGLIWVARSQ